MSPATPGQKNALLANSGNRTPTCGSPNAKRNSTTTSGELRNTVTQARPTKRSGGSGETRNAARRVPRTREPIAANKQRRSVPRKPAAKRGNSAISTSTSCLLVVETGRADRSRLVAPTGQPVTVVQLQASAGGRDGAWGSTLPAVAFQAA